MIFKPEGLTLGHCKKHATGVSHQKVGESQGIYTLTPISHCLRVAERGST